MDVDVGRAVLDRGDHLRRDAQRAVHAGAAWPAESKTDRPGPPVLPEVQVGRDRSAAQTREGQPPGDPPSGGVDRQRAGEDAAGARFLDGLPRHLLQGVQRRLQTDRLGGARARARACDDESAEHRRGQSESTPLHPAPRIARSKIAPRHLSRDALSTGLRRGRRGIHRTRQHWVRFRFAFAAFLVAALAFSGHAPANVALTKLSTDPFTNTSSQHRTQVEPDSFAFGSTIVAAFQSGRFFDGGASDIGWATSTDAGGTWKHGFLPRITKYQGAGPYDRASDPSVAYDAAHQVWLIQSLALRETPSVSGAAVVVSRSSD